MQHHSHAVAWIDHLQARVFHLGLSGLDEIVLHPRMPTRHIHHKANSIGGGHVHESDEFLRQVLDAASDAGEIVILGPSDAKSNSPNIFGEHDPAVGNRIVAVEAADHPSDAQIIAYAKRHSKIGLVRAASDQR